MFVKICGMTRREDIEVAVENGVDAVGFIFAPSPRRVTPEQVSKLADSLHILKVGVFVNEDIERVRAIRQQCGLDIIQLHGDESPDYCAQLGGRLFKAFRLKDAATISRFAEYAPNIKIVLDAYVKGMAGGTGNLIDRSLLDQIPDFSRIILAGGVGPENSVELVKRYHPFGIDVNSKVERKPGIKDHEKIKDLFEQIKLLKDSK